MSETPEQTVDGIAQAFADAFNSKDAAALGELFREDAAALGELFREDAEFVNIFGMRSRGRASIESGHAGLFAHALSGNRLVVEKGDVQVLPGGPLLGHVPWTRQVLDGAGPSLPPGSGIFTLVLVNDDEGWRLAACTNVQEVTPPGPPTKP